jgi:DNA-binding response OmpR family regulator
MTKKQTILIVEDDDWLAEQYGRLLNEAGYTVELAAHALAAMDAIDTVRPDLILLDMLLAGPNAFTLLHELQSHADLATIPVIMCTNSADQIADEDISAYGVLQVLDKATVLPEEIVAAIRKVLL